MSRGLGDVYKRQCLFSQLCLSFLVCPSLCLSTLFVLSTLSVFPCLSVSLSVNPVCSPNFVFSVARYFRLCVNFVCSLRSKFRVRHSWRDTLKSDFFHQWLRFWPVYSQRFIVTCMEAAVIGIGRLWYVVLHWLVSRSLFQFSRKYRTWNLKTRPYIVQGNSFFFSFFSMSRLTKMRIRCRVL